MTLEEFQARRAYADEQQLFNQKFEIVYPEYESQNNLINGLPFSWIHDTDVVVALVSRLHDVRIEPRSVGVGEYGFITGAAIIFNGNVYPLNGSSSEVLFSQDYHFRYEQFQMMALSWLCHFNDFKYEES